MAVLADLPELVALGNLAAVAPSKMAAAFNEPEKFFDHLDLKELARLQAACERLAVVQREMTAAMDIYLQAAQKILDAAKQVAEAENAD